MAFSWKTFFITFVPVVLNLVFGSLVTYAGLKNYNRTRKAPYTPPAWVFAAVWVLMYALIATAGYFGYENQPSETYKNYFLIAFYAQVILNFLWCLVFFGALVPRLALVVLLALMGVVVYLVYISWSVSKLAAAFFIIYLAWLLFATFLNVGYSVVNKA